MSPIDTRQFSQHTYEALEAIKQAISSADCSKASGAVQSLPAYISTWGLHRLAGDSVKYNKYGSSETKYKGKVYHQFLVTLQRVSPEVEFKPDDPKTIVNLNDVRAYAGLNRLAILLAREWSFWAVAVLGKAEES